MSELNAEERILKHCRATNNGITQQWVMRDMLDGLVGVIDLAKSEPKPGGYDWEHRDKRVAVGYSWEEVASILDL